jgi:4'-phosphopantetheinyl transferase EntD
MLELILPAGVESEERFGAALCPEPFDKLRPALVEVHQHLGGILFPEEEKIIAHAVPERRRDYTTVRSCARACLQRLGYPPVPILPGVGGAPIWPAGIRGSMTHCTGYAAAAVGPHPPIFAIGIDAEPDAPLPDGVLDLVATAAERDRLAAVSMESDSPHWDRLLFSAKEAVYKAWFPLVGEWLDHQQAEIIFDPQEGTFAVLLSRDGLVVDGRQIRRLHGRWIRDRGILLTAVVLHSA